MGSRTLSKRLERLETQIMPAGEPIVIEIQFVSADGSITGRLPVRCLLAYLLAASNVAHAQSELSEAVQYYERYMSFVPAEDEQQKQQKQLLIDKGKRHLGFARRRTHAGICCRLAKDRQTNHFRPAARSIALKNPRHVIA